MYAKKVSRWNTESVINSNRQQCTPYPAPPAFCPSLSLSQPHVSSSIVLGTDGPFPLTSLLLPLVEEVEDHRAHGESQPDALCQVYLVAVDQDGRQQSHNFSRQTCGGHSKSRTTGGGGGAVTIVSCWSRHVGEGGREAGNTSFHGLRQQHAAATGWRLRLSSGDQTHATPVFDDA